MRRRDFLPEGEWSHEADDTPLAIGHGQTTSQPSLIRQMIELLELPPGARVLEVGTGCGYQTALLAEVAGEVWSVEFLEPLAVEAARRLRKVGIGNAHVLVGDGWRGLPELAPFQGIIVSASAPEVPGPLLEQLAEGGRLVIPVGEDLYVFTRHGDTCQSKRICGVRFVPMVGPNAEGARHRQA